MEVALELVDVAGGLHVVLGDRNGAVPLLVDVDDEGRADHPLDELAVEQLFPVRAVSVERLFVRIGQQRKTARLLLAELNEFFLSVRRDADHVHPRGIEFVHRRCEVDCLGSAARSQGRWIEVDDHTLSSEVRERYILAVRVRQGKGRRRIAIAEPSGHTRTLALLPRSVESLPPPWERPACNTLRI